MVYTGQRTNTDLIQAELTKKRRANWKKNKSYEYGRVLNEEIIEEREAYCQLRDVWKDLSRIQPNLLEKGRKKAAATPAAAKPAAAEPAAKRAAKPAAKPAVEQAVEQAPPVQTWSGRIVVKTKAFEAGMK